VTDLAFKIRDDWDTWVIDSVNEQTDTVTVLVVGIHTARAQNDQPLPSRNFDDKDKVKPCGVALPMQRVRHEAHIQATVHSHDYCTVPPTNDAMS
jgi:hypothetical protein